MSLSVKELRDFVLKKITDIGSTELDIEKLQVFEASREELYCFIKVIREVCVNSNLILSFEEASILVFQKKIELSRWAQSRLRDFFISSSENIHAKIVSGCEYGYNEQENKWTKIK